MFLTDVSAQLLSLAAVPGRFVSGAAAPGRTTRLQTSETQRRVNRTVITKGQYPPASVRA